MKYLKSFDLINESDIITEIRELTNNCLAYLMDDNICSLSMAPGRDRTRSLHIMLIIDKKHWVDIKDYIIPYIEIMNNTFHIMKGIGSDNRNDVIGISYEDAIEEEYYTNFLTMEEFLEGDFDFIEECGGEDYVNQIFFNIERKRRV